MEETSPRTKPPPPSKAKKPPPEKLSMYRTTPVDLSHYESFGYEQGSDNESYEGGYDEGAYEGGYEEGFYEANYEGRADGQYERQTSDLDGASNPDGKQEEKEEGESLVGMFEKDRPNLSQFMGSFDISSTSTQTTAKDIFSKSRPDLSPPGDMGTIPGTLDVVGEDCLTPTGEGEKEDQLEGDTTSTLGTVEDAKCADNNNNDKSHECEHEGRGAPKEQQPSIPAGVQQKEQPERKRESGAAEESEQTETSVSEVEGKQQANKEGDDRKQSRGRSTTQEGGGEKSQEDKTNSTEDGATKEGESYYEGGYDESAYEGGYEGGYDDYYETSAEGQVPRPGADAPPVVLARDELNRPPADGIQEESETPDTQGKAIEPGPDADSGGILINGKATAHVLFDYAPKEGETGLVTLHAGDIITVTAVRTGGWWSGVNTATGESGDFPGNYVKVIRTLEEEEELERRDRLVLEEAKAELERMKEEEKKLRKELTRIKSKNKKFKDSFADLSSSRSSPQMLYLDFSKALIEFQEEEERLYTLEAQQSKTVNALETMSREMNAYIKKGSTLEPFKAGILDKTSELCEALVDEKPLISYKSQQSVFCDLVREFRGLLETQVTKSDRLPTL